MRNGRKVALVTGVTGQDGSYLTRMLLDKGYEVHGIRRTTSGNNIGRIADLVESARNPGSRFFIYHGDITDSSSIGRIIEIAEPDEIYNLAAQSHVKVSFEVPVYTAQASAISTLRILEAVRQLGIEKEVRFYQASTSELYGKVQEVPQTEDTPFYPRSPYGVAKLYSFWICKNYREAYGIHASNGILFNHESPIRGEHFVTRKVTSAVARICLNMQETLAVGNLDAQRDWGHAREYVEGMWHVLQHSEADDFVLATNKTTSVREFIRMAFGVLGVKIEFEGRDLKEKGVCVKTGKTLVRVDPDFFRPAEVDLLIGNASKAKNLLGWEPKTSLESLCREMVIADFYLAAKDKGLAVGDRNFLQLVADQNGFFDWHETTGRLIWERFKK